MKFSLRTAFVVLTICCIAAGIAARVRFFQERATFHRKLALAPSGPSPSEISATLGPLEARDQIAEILRRNRRHEELAICYERAIYRPWRAVLETSEDTR